MRMKGSVPCPLPVPARWRPGVLQQVVHDLAQLLRIARNARTTRVQLDFHGTERVFFPVQMQHIGDQGIEVQGLQLRRWQPRVIAELVDQALHRHRPGRRWLATDLARMACSAGGTLPDSFISRRSADSWMGVNGFLDFVRKAARHLAPGLRALGGNNL